MPSSEPKYVTKQASILSDGPLVERKVCSCVSQWCGQTLFSNLRLISKILNGLSPPQLRDFVYTRSPSSVCSARLSSVRGCNIPLHRTIFGQSAFTLKASIQWNTLPDDVRSCSSLSTFKNQAEKMSKSCSAVYSLALKSGLYNWFLI